MLNGCISTHFRKQMRFVFLLKCVDGRERLISVRYQLEVIYLKVKEGTIRTEKVRERERERDRMTKRKREKNNQMEIEIE